MEGYDDSQRRNIDFSTLTRTEAFGKSSEEFKIIDKAYSDCYRFPTNIISVLNETLEVTKDNKEYTLQVIPISYELLTSLMNKPHKQPVKNSAWRLFTGYAEDVTTGSDSSNKPFPVVQIIAHKSETPGTYTIRYITRPKPIILAEFDGVSIDGYDEPWADDGEQACELPNELQPEVIQRAAELAKAIYIGDLSTQIQVGTASQTEIGYIPQGGGGK